MKNHEPEILLSEESQNFFKKIDDDIEKMDKRFQEYLERKKRFEIERARHEKIMNVFLGIFWIVVMIAIIKNWIL